jgi:hypothetical protein
MQKSKPQIQLRSVASAASCKTTYSDSALHPPAISFRMDGFADSMTRRVFHLVLALLLLASVRAEENAKPFRAGTAAALAGRSVVINGCRYTFPEDNFKFTGTHLAPISAYSLSVRLDPSDGEGLLVSSPFWALNQPNQTADIELRFTVNGANWVETEQMHASASEDARVEESLTIGGGPAANARSFRTATGGSNLPPAIWFDLAPQSVVVRIHLESGQHGTAVLRAYRLRFAVKDRAQESTR